METTTSDADNHPASNFRPTTKSKLQMKRKSAGKNQDVANAEVQVLQSIGNALGQKQTPDFKDEDELFGALIASQMRQIAPERKVVAKMQTSNIVYQEMLAPFNSMPLSYTGERASWKYSQQQVQELHQAQQQHHNFQFSRDRKRRSHKRNQCSASDFVGLTFTRSYRSRLLITTPTTTPSPVKTSLYRSSG